MSGVTSTEHHNLRASLLMVAAMACFALEDVLIKQLARGMPTGQVLMLIGAGGGIVFGLLAWLSGRSLLSRALLLRPVLVRNLSEAELKYFAYSARHYCEMAESYRGG